jgi:5-oxopent-3-ene-1,2,5-tricarboxylate decarboxylase/2-hydroxyhepta-2,4-diene-1,7-dioate isomerase
MTMAIETSQRPCAARWPAGTVYGALLNYRADLDALGPRMISAPYNAPPRAPVLYIKPRNTWIGDGDQVALPAGATLLQVGATLGLVLGEPCVRAAEATALDTVAALTVVNDACLPHEEVFRPAIRERCRDGFCPIGPRVPRRVDAAALEAMVMSTYVDGELRARWGMAELVRPAARLLADVSEFMTLHAGDVLLIGCPRSAPTASPGQRVAVEITGVGRIENPVVTAGGAA